MLRFTLLAHTCMVCRPHSGWQRGYMYHGLDLTIANLSLGMS